MTCYRRFVYACILVQSADEASKEQAQIIIRFQKDNVMLCSKFFAVSELPKVCILFWQRFGLSSPFTEVMFFHLPCLLGCCVYA
jgi:hypothetical protein